MQILFNGIITGLTIAVFALAYTVVFLPTRVFHVALGGVYALVPFVTWSISQRGGSTSVAIALALIVGTSISLGCELLNHSFLEKKQTGLGGHLISSLGIYIAIVQVIVLIWGNETKLLKQGTDAILQLGSVSIPMTQVVGAIAAVIVLGFFYAWLQFSNLGLQFRALADNPKEFGLQGYDVSRLRLVAFGTSGLLASIASLLVAYDVGFDPQGGLSALLIAIVAMIIGSQQSFWGALAGGILLGVTRALAVWVLSARWQEAVTFLVLALFLFVRPNGLLGRKGRLEAEA